MKSTYLPARSIPGLRKELCNYKTSESRDGGMLQTKFAQNAGVHGIEDRSTWADRPDDKSLHLQQAGAAVLPGEAGISVHFNSLLPLSDGSTTLPVAQIPLTYSEHVSGSLEQARSARTAHAVDTFNRELRKETLVEKHVSIRDKVTLLTPCSQVLNGLSSPATCLFGSCSWHAVSLFLGFRVGRKLLHNK